MGGGLFGSSRKPRERREKARNNWTREETNATRCQEEGRTTGMNRECGMARRKRTREGSRSEKGRKGQYIQRTGETREEPTNRPAPRRPSTVRACLGSQFRFRFGPAGISASTDVFYLERIIPLSFSFPRFPFSAPAVPRSGIDPVALPSFFFVPFLTPGTTKITKNLILSLVYLVSAFVPSDPFAEYFVISYCVRT